MRYLLLMLAVFISGVASAMCGMNGIWSLSKKSTLNRNGLVILEFYAFSQELVPGLNKKYPVYLQSAKGKVTLVVMEVLRGEFNLTQVILKPASELSVNETWQLHIDSLPKYESGPHGKYNSTLKKWEALSFTVTDYIDYELPVLICPPVETKKTYTAFGCGPDRSVYFKLSGQDKSELFVRASVKNKTTGKTTDYLLRIENDIVIVGHGMCSGAFHFDNGDNYEVSFALFDQSGNKASLTQPVAFTKPIPADGE